MLSVERLSGSLLPERYSVGQLLRDGDRVWACSSGKSVGLLASCWTSDPIAMGGTDFSLSA